MAYSDEELLALLRELADEVGHSPTLADVRERDHLPSTATYYNHFGSWRKAVEAAGFESRDQITKIEEDDLLDEIRRLEQDLGDPPTASQMDAHGEFGKSTYYGRFGSWRKAVEAAGFEPRDPVTKIDGGDLLNELRRLEQEIGETPTASQMDEHGEFWASTYRNRFGAWGAALEEAGLTVTTRGQKLTDDQLIDALRDFATETESPPTMDEMDREGPHAASTYVRHFGSWANALQEVGYTTTAREISGDD